MISKMISDQCKSSEQEIEVTMIRYLPNKTQELLKIDLILIDMLLTLTHLPNQSQS